MELVLVKVEPLLGLFIRTTLKEERKRYGIETISVVDYCFLTVCSTG